MSLSPLPWSTRLLWLASLTLLFASAAGFAGAHPLASTGVSPAVSAKVLEEFPDAVFPAGEEDMCSPAEHSFYGPTSYCFAEFTTGAAWNMVEVSLRPLYVPGEAGGGANIYGHAAWRREWTRCARLRAPVKPRGADRRIPGELISNEDCGRGQPEQELGAETDDALFELSAWPRIRKHRPLRSVTRGFIYSFVAPGLARYWATRSGPVYTFTNALGDSFRYGPKSALEPMIEAQP